MKCTWHLPNYVQTTGLAGLSPKILKIYKTIAVTSVLASLRSLSSSSLPSFLLAAHLLPSSLLSLFASALAPPPRCAPPFSPLRLLTHLPSFLLAFLDFFICLFLALPFPCLYVTPPPSPSSLFSSLPTCCPFCLPPHLSFALPAYILVSFLGFLIGLSLALPFPCLCLTPALAVLSLFLSPYLPSISPPSPSAVILTCLPPFLLA